MWAYESVFYQIYPLDSAEHLFENDGVLTPRIRKVIDWIPHIKILVRMRSIFHRYLNPIPMDIIPEISVKSTYVWAQTKILPMSARHCTRKESKSCWTAYSIMSAADSGHFRMFWKNN